MSIKIHMQKSDFEPTCDVLLLLFHKLSRGICVNVSGKKDTKGQTQLKHRILKFRG